MRFRVPAAIRNILRLLVRCANYSSKTACAQRLRGFASCHSNENSHKNGGSDWWTALVCIKAQENIASGSKTRRFPNKMAPRRDGRVVDGGGLENHCTRKGTGGSNPSPSANAINNL